MSVIDIEQRINEIKIHLNELQYDGSVPEFKGGFILQEEGKDTLAEMRQELSALQQNYYVNSDVRRASSKLKKFLKKSIGKITGVYVKPLVADQNLYNINVLQAIEKVCMLLNQQSEEINQLKSRIASHETEKGE